jgi:CDP-diacylglycerol--glycerol-3-phosphate 3-phosphatidyltransferase
MLAKGLKAPVTKLIAPLVNFLVWAKVSANAISVTGVFGSAIAAFLTLPKGNFLLGAVLISIFTLFDLFDGAVARASGSNQSKVGAVLDSTLDRIGDYAILVAAFIYFSEKDSTISWLLVINMFLGFMVPYIRARAEANGIECSLGIAERSERLIILLIGFAAFGLGSETLFKFSLYLLTLLSAITICQRMFVVFKNGQIK